MAVIMAVIFKARSCTRLYPIQISSYMGVHSCIRILFALDFPPKYNFKNYPIPGTVRTRSSVPTSRYLLNLVVVHVDTAVATNFIDSTAFAAVAQIAVHTARTSTLKY